MKKSFFIRNFCDFNRSSLLQFVNFVRMTDLFIFSFNSVDNIVSNLVSLYTFNTCIPVLTTGDGRCLFHSISICLFGHEKFTHLIKISCVFMLLEHEAFFTNILFQQDRSLSFNQLLEDNSNNDKYGSHYSLIALSLLTEELFILTLLTKITV